MCRCSADVAAKSYFVMLFARWLGKWLALTQSHIGGGLCSMQTMRLDVVAFGEKSPGTGRCLLPVDLADEA